MQVKGLMRVLVVIIAVFSMSVMFVSTSEGKVFAPKDGYLYWYYPAELPEADRAVEAARQAGKDRQCPDEYNEAWLLKEKAYATYAACRDAEAIAMAIEATKMAKALCPSGPTCELTAVPMEIGQGQSATLRLTTWGKVTSAVLDGTEVAATGGTKTVRPTSTASYTAKIAGPVSSATCSVTVMVTVPPPPPPPPPASRVIDRLNIYVNFDFDKSSVKKSDEAELKKAIDFVRKYPGAKVKLEGHTDSKGTDKYNQKLSEKRADAVMNYLIKEGAVNKARISAMGYGESKPIAPNLTKEGKDNPEGRAKNRRVEILIISE